jgi:hypothetical protein
MEGPFSSAASSGGGSYALSWQALTGLPSLRRKDGNSAGSTDSTSRTCVLLVNKNGTTSPWQSIPQVYTNNHNGVTDLNKAVVFSYGGALAETTWCCSFSVRNRGSNTGELYLSKNITVWCFGAHNVGTNSNPEYDFNWGGHNGGSGNANSSTRDNPATGATYYSKQVGVTYNWSNHEFTFTFPNNGDLDAMLMRFDVDSADNIWGNDYGVYFDRVTLHPLNLKMSYTDGTASPDHLSEGIFGVPYAT